MQDSGFSSLIGLAAREWCDMTKTNGVAGMTARLFLTTALVLGASTIALAQSGQGGRQGKDDHGAGAEKVLYIWAQDQAQVAPDFLAWIGFAQPSSKSGGL